MSRLLICELFSFQDIDTYCAVDRMTEEFGHTLLRLPPYHSAILNPIEEMWALCKNYVAMNNTRQTLKTVSILIFSNCEMDNVSPPYLLSLDMN